MRHAAAFVFALLSLTARTTADEATEFQVVAHPSVKGTWISRTNLQLVFTRKTERWGDLVTARPVDQSASSSVRRAFTASVLRLSLGEVQRYWQDRVAADRVFPPLIKASDAEVLEFVASNAGAIGYVAADTAIPPGVKLISIVD